MVGYGVRAADHNELWRNRPDARADRWRAVKSIRVDQEHRSLMQ